MSTTDPYKFERETDEQLARINYEMYEAEDRQERVMDSIVAATRPAYYYRGKKRVTDRTFEEALPMIEEALAAYDVEHPNGGEDWDRIPSLSGGDTANAPSVESLRRLLTSLGEVGSRITELDAEHAKISATYTGWSRFFIVTSSAGHIHSSTHCSTCKIRTRFGWVTELSGHTEEQAVAALGSRLCSVCFPSAPVEHQGGRFTPAQAEKIRVGGLKAAAEIIAKDAKAQAEKCPGSGTAAIEPTRTGFAYGNWGTCSHCHATVAFASKGSYLLRAHKPGGSQS